MLHIDQTPVLCFSSNEVFHEFEVRQKMAYLYVFYMNDLNHLGYHQIVGGFTPIKKIIEPALFALWNC